MQLLKPSELVLNADGSIYHLRLRPEQVAPTVLLVGDPGRVPRVSRHFDHIEHVVERREFITHTGMLAGKRFTVLSTGIGTDNIDIVLNELDALVNIDFETRLPRSRPRVLNLIRLGTSGGLSPDVEVGSVVVSAWGVGLDNLMRYYKRPAKGAETQLEQQFEAFTAELGMDVEVYAAPASGALLKHFASLRKGITLTCPGFYGPQGRNLRLQSIYHPGFFDRVGQFEFQGYRITNFEMETAAIFGLADMLGHRALSCNAILANRVRGEFAADPAAVVNNLIETVLEILTSAEFGGV